MDKYTNIRKIGSGSFAKVYLADDEVNGRKVALKAMKKTSLKSEKLRERLFREIDNMEVLKHEGIVQYYESFETKTDVYIAMEYLPGGELFEYITNKGALTESHAQKMFKDIANAIAYCHKNGIAHRDLKLENILLTREERPKLIDFGFSKEVHPESMIATYCGSPLYASPEMVQGKPYEGPECDIWSLGVILYCMLTATMPFDDSDWHDFVFSVKRGDYPMPNVSEDARHLISRMLDPYAKTRATIDEVLAHKWLNPPPRKTSLQLPSSSLRSRRRGISHSKSSSLQIRSKLMHEYNQNCSCECHSSSLNGQGLESHCEDCRPMVDLQFTRETPAAMDTLSVSSSGYSSMESLYFKQPGVSSRYSSIESLSHNKYDAPRGITGLSKTDTLDDVFA